MSVRLSIHESDANRRRWQIHLTGAVQGVGFRPFVHRLAVSEGLGGFVRNTSEGVLIEVEGTLQALERFQSRLEAEVASPACIHEIWTYWLNARGQQDFVIASSTSSGRRAAVVLSDLATCPQCLRELTDPADRRYRYPFITCVHCGPRYSVIEATPYDRTRTTMDRFGMCSACREEYTDPASRRFHAETNACPDCGPQLALWEAGGEVQSTGDEALMEAVRRLREGAVIGLKGLGGFQLLGDARNETAVQRLRERKHRPGKPFALMVPALADASALAQITPEEERLLVSPAAPIVLLRAGAGARELAPGIAPASPLLGIMLPCTPLHHLLMQALGFPVVATSGNRGGEPIVTDEEQALQRLAGLADAFLVHDRPIARRVDDSVARVMAGREVVLRCARGYAPLSVAYPPARKTSLGLGGHHKNSLALAGSGRLVLGPHVGDLDNAAARADYLRSLESMTALYVLKAHTLACDTHPDYYTSLVAESRDSPVRHVPHHLAHVLAGMADNGLKAPVLGVAWDGTGYGNDGSIWGGEFIAVEGERYRRAAHLLRFRLPGGEAGVREPRRAAFGVLHAVYGDGLLSMTDLPPLAAFAPAERTVLATMLARGVNSPPTSSAGRLFDAVASLLGLCHKASFEGQAGMAVEYAAERAGGRLHSLVPAGITEEGDMLVIDWRPTLSSLVEAYRASAGVEPLAAGFHDALIEALVSVAARTGINHVLLTGGCFQNARLTEGAVWMLREAGMEPAWHRRIPPNDGGLAAGQAAFAAHPLHEVHS